MTAVHPGALVVDVRPVADFVREHVAGSLFVDFDRRTFLPIVRLFVPAQAPVVLVAPDREVAAAAGALLESDARRVVERIVPDVGLAAAGARVEALPTVGVEELARRLAAPARAFRLVDVRQRFEWQLGYIGGAVLVPLTALDAASARWAPADELLCVCEQGVRSATAASFLRRRGFAGAASVEGGIAAWAGSGRPLEED